MEKTTKKVTLIKVALSLLSLVAVLAGQIVSQLIGSGLLAAGIPADLRNPDGSGLLRADCASRAVAAVQ